ncbi:MAG: SUMF1/EgtB/PvdO family nonheme iron enzyme [Polyangiaceae bacterium]|nr:SUMF1/EgtB/PvdO family nonheme iron enzyme [Polyangiaceae bacterium]
MVGRACGMGLVVAFGGLLLASGTGCLFPSLDSLVCEDDCGGAGGAGGAAENPCALRDGMRGTVGVLVTPPAGPPFCIEPTEVTVAQYYDLWRGATFPLDPDPTPSECDEPDLITGDLPNTPEWFAPTAYTTDHYDEHPDEQDRPIQSIHWCHAQAYCHWAGKHLCRAGAGAGPANISIEGWNETTQWYHACRGAQELAYGYSDAYIAGTCNDSNNGAENNFQTSAVDQPPGCTSEWPSGVIYDMSGNVQEFEDNCDPDTGLCVMRGGAVTLENDDGPILTCAGGDYLPNGPNTDWGRMHRLDLTGMRCCYEPEEPQ